MEAVCPSETVVPIYHNTQYHNADDYIMNRHCRENLLPTFKVIGQRIRTLEDNIYPSRGLKTSTFNPLKPSGHYMYHLL
jgi:hypothetical protein